MAQTIKRKSDGLPSLKPTFMCMQCPSIFTRDAMKAHFNGPKSHSFCKSYEMCEECMSITDNLVVVESRSGYLFCYNCEDFVYDPTLEGIRLQGTRYRHEVPLTILMMSTGSKKRKFDDYANGEPEDPRLITANTAPAPCRAIGLRGLYNMGNTCFMSVVVQSLIHNPFLRAYYLSRGHPECKDEAKKERCTSCALDEIFTEFYSMEKTEGYGAVPMLIRSWKSAEHLAGYQQQDAHEYMQFILNSLHSANGGSTDGDCSCIIHKTFYGKLSSTVTCDKCKNITTAQDPFMDLSLDLRHQAKKRKLNGEAKNTAEEGDSMLLQECLRRFTNVEHLAAAEYTCQKCDGPCDATKQLSVRSLPPVLSIHLKVSLQIITNIAFGILTLD
jgi:ubiquitin carboxyl-terminal hydrolase 22/27/51